MGWNMSMNLSVTVFAFRFFDRAVGEDVVAGYKATREAIDRHFRGSPIPMTDEVVHASDLDPMGHWQRRATGWADLDGLAPEAH